MRSEFITQYSAVAVPAPWERFTSTIKSTARFENYAFMSVTPSFGRYLGHRRLGKIANIRYVVPNLEFDASFSVLLRDIQDDQTGGYMLKPKELAVKAKVWPGRVIYQALAQGKTTAHFDSTNFFATSHNVGGWATTAPSVFTSGAANQFTYTATGTADGALHRIIILLNNQIMPPMWLQLRKEPQLNTDADTPQALFAKEVKYWADMELAAPYGYWWTALNIDITNTPSLTELQNLLQGATQAFRGYVLPVSTATDIPEYVNAQHEFNEQTTTVVVNPALEILMRQVLHNEVIVNSGAPVTNVFRGYATLIAAPDIDPNAAQLSFASPG